jgi:hypothetical protein
MLGLHVHVSVGATMYTSDSHHFITFVLYCYSSKFRFIQYFKLIRVLSRL